MEAANQEPLTYLRLIQEIAWRRYLRLVNRRQAVIAIDEIRHYLINAENEGRQLDEEAVERRRLAAQRSRERLAWLCNLHVMRHMLLSRGERFDEDCVWRRALTNPGEAEARETMEERTEAVVDVVFKYFFLRIRDVTWRFVQPEGSEGRMFEDEVWLRYFNWIARNPGDRRHRFEVFERLSIRTRVHGILMNHPAWRRAHEGEPAGVMDERVIRTANRIYAQLQYTDEEVERIQRVERMTRGTRSG